MIELHPVKKNKVNLTDYDFRQDIRCRLFFSSITKEEMEVLEEILFSPLKFPIKDISRNLEMSMDVVKKILEKITSLSLISIENDHVLVNKELRKYFDGEIQKFDERFVPGMEYIQSLLKKVPIQVLPTWYLIPRTSDNIFDSLVEKIFNTPQIYQRHLHETRPVDGVQAKIYDRLFQSTELKIYLSDLQDLCEQYQVSVEELHEIILELEFNFIACLGYEIQDDVFVEVLTPFYEWKEFLTFSKNHELKSIPSLKGLDQFRAFEYAFSKDLETVLQVASKKEIKIETSLTKKFLDPKSAQLIIKELDAFTDENANETLLYLLQLIEKSILTGLCKIEQSRLVPLPFFKEWVGYDEERKAHYIYKHPNNRVLNPNCPQDLLQEKNIREIEKSLSKASRSDWIYFDHFLKGCIAPIGDHGKIELKKTGKSWRYALPDYSEKEKLFIQIALLEWLFESGIVQTGIHQFRPCFKLTTLGKKIFV